MRLSILGLDVSIRRTERPATSVKKKVRCTGDKLHIGPGPNWQKPDSTWMTLDADRSRGDISYDWNTDSSIPIADASLSHIYGSHVFEHMSIFAFPTLLRECQRMLRNEGVIRLVLPDDRKSIENYIRGNDEFSLFQRRKDRARKRGVEYTLWECMRECFISPSAQEGILGKNVLAHQNAWDVETICRDLERVGFDKTIQSAFEASPHKEFHFEGTFPSEANEHDRSLYIEAQKLTEIAD